MTNLKYCRKKLFIFNISTKARSNFESHRFTYILEYMIICTTVQLYKRKLLTVFTNGIWPLDVDLKFVLYINFKINSNNSDK